MSIENYILIIEKNIPLFHNDSLILNVWKLIVLTMIVLQIFLVPLKVSFDIHVNYNDFIFVLLSFYVPLTIFGFDILVNFNSTYYEEGELIQDRSKIILNYLRYQFFLDSFTTAFIIMSNLYNN